MRKLWNLPDQPVWSLSSINKAGVGNMNICTYVTSISMEPKLMLVALYKGTKTLQNVTETKKAVLQLLSTELAPVTRVCGHESGHTTDKIMRLKKRYPLGNVDGMPYFTSAVGYMELSLKKLISVDGDHDVGVFSVTAHKNLNDVDILTTNYMRKKKLLR
jgi:flavin reductase (DIM6/NTAB) family NADH-FMN oxidoreductase RutF